MKSSPPAISASDGRRCRVVGRLSLRLGPDLSVATGALDRRVCPRWRKRHRRAADGAMAFGTDRPAIHYREPAGCGHQHRHRGGRECAPDGYTLLLAGLPNAINAALFEKLNFNFIRDIVPVAASCRIRNVMVVNPSVPVKTVPEFIAYAKANPGKINMASAGNRQRQPSRRRAVQDDGRRQPGPRAVSRQRTGAGGPARRAGGGLFPSLPSSIEYIKTGKLRGLAVTSAKRSEALPDLPTVGEFVPGYEMSAWYGVGARQRARRPTSSTRSTRRSTRALPIPR